MTEEIIKEYRELSVFLLQVVGGLISDERTPEKSSLNDLCQSLQKAVDPSQIKSVFRLVMEEVLRGKPVVTDLFPTEIKRLQSSFQVQTETGNDLHSLIKEFKNLTNLALHQVEVLSISDSESRKLFLECREGLSELSSATETRICVDKCKRLFSNNLLFDKNSERERDELKEIITILAGSISGLLNSSGDFDSGLDECVSQLQEAHTLSEVRQIRESLLQQALSLQFRTRHMVEHIRQAQIKIDDANKKIQALQEQMERIKQEIVIDPLTRVYNRRAYDEKIKHEIMSFRRYARPTALVIADIDHFKRINDTYGHHAGDMVLKNLSKLMKKEIREIDVLARYGGDEFALILPHTSYRQAYDVAERIRQKIADKPMQYKDKSFSVTVSFGVGSLKDDDTGESYVERVDRALYRAKEQGCNRVVGEED